MKTSFCERKGRHKFRPRYVTTPDLPPNYVKTIRCYLEAAKDAGEFALGAVDTPLVDVTTYVGDICVWCGAFAERPAAGEQ